MKEDKNDMDSFLASHMAVASTQVDGRMYDLVVYMGIFCGGMNHEKRSDY